MKQYQDALREILEEGNVRSDRTGTGTKGVFGQMQKYDLRKGFPIVTSKKVLFEAVVRELIWMLHGCTNINEQDLTLHTPIWDAWADKHGELGPIYGKQWRDWEAPHFSTERELEAYGQSTDHYDQIQEAIRKLQQDRFSRRNIVSAWNVGEISEMKLPPCHMMFQLYVNENGDEPEILNMCMYQRSADMALGVPFNISSYALLLTLFARHVGMTPGVLTHFIGDAHIYLNHIEGVEKLLTREPLPLPTLKIDGPKDMFEIKPEHISLENYHHHKFIKFPVSV